MQSSEPNAPSVMQQTPSFGVGHDDPTGVPLAPNPQLQSPRPSVVHCTGAQTHSSLEGQPLPAQQRPLDASLQVDVFTFVSAS